jgi:uncharacterized membrane protein YdjX (TVP38/TMEM64 family)
MKILKDTYFQIITFLTGILILYTILKVLLIPTLTSPEFITFTAELGFYGYFVLVGYIVFSDIFAPLPSSLGFLTGVTIYGIKTAVILLYISSLLSASANFYISRRFGRSWVTRFAGKRAMKEIDQFTALEGTKALLVGRVLGFGVFEFVSYAAGLTNIPFRTYFIITAGASAITSFFIYFIYRDINFQSVSGVMVWLGSLLLAGLVFGLLVRSYVQWKQQNPPQT